MKDLDNYIKFEFFVSSLTPMQSTLAQANQYTDTQVNGAIAECKQYADDASTILDTKIDDTTANILQDAKDYTDAQCSILDDKINQIDIVVNVDEIYNDLDLKAYSDYWDNAIVTIDNKLTALNASTKANIFFTTDIHMYIAKTQDMDVENSEKNSVFFVNEMNRKHKIHAYINNGDLILSAGKKTDVLQKFSDLVDIYKKADTQVLITKGNHDDNGYGNEDRPAHVIYDNERHAATVAKFYNNNIVYDVVNADKSYYYYDIAQHKIRVLCLNTCDFDLRYVDNAWVSSFGTSGISDSQLNFVATALNFAETGWSVLVIGHHCLRRVSAMGTTSSGINTANNGNVLWEILKAFKNKSFYTSTETEKGYYNHSVAVNYVNNQSNEIIACLSGHTHADKTTTVDNIRLISVDSGSTNRGAGRIPGSNLETSADILTIDTTTKTINLTRYGYGSDRTITY